MSGGTRLASRRTPARWLRLLFHRGGRLPDLDWITTNLCVSGALNPWHIEELARIGIGAVVDLREEGKDDEELMAQHDIRFLHLPVRDRWPPSQSQMTQGADWVLTQMEQQRKTLVHCKEGIGRSAALACCVLMRQGHDLTSAVRLVRARRWGVALNRRHLEGLQEFAQHVDSTAPSSSGEGEAGNPHPEPPA